ncbi:hypothetical protein B0J15DRAFT_393989 [Fusarium solani]|uniref:Nucleoside phosphorylase domain-containing protein n=1 Tax=Fusarium solani TaxID=169388 RepID=A0A9P9HWS0_FUSSL|nr:uncharacterized protein B0J15DRAFT_393989 [Fusarium solani]KAH7264352.1 hypothetical protein B0J15DRAFT_393989 [Fusarium solani]
MDQKRSWSGDQAAASSPCPPKRQKTLRYSPTDAFPHSQYTIAWICALHIEMAAARAMLDAIHPDLPQDASDKNTYMLGSIGPHNIVIACLPNGHYGTNNAASVSTHILRSFPSIRKGFMVGIGGGVPSRADIRLGDVVVGTRVMQYDLGKIVDGNIQRTAVAKSPSYSLQTAVSNLRSKHELEPSRVPTILQDMAAKYPEYGHPASPDRLFLATYKHDPQFSSCSACDQSSILPKSTRMPNHPKIHHGAIASGNQVMKDSLARDDIARKLDIICFEMEAAGLMDVLPCLPIRGICDYADSHKSKEWQKYAAATAAAYAKELIEILPANNENLDNADVANPPLQDALPNRRRLLLDSFKFEQIDSRKISIKTAHSKTCHWFLKHPQYLKWLDPQKHTQHHGFLWIRGKPGVGKSTIMKFVYLKTKRKKSHAHGITASFFFHARGEYLEKSIAGMYRSLLLQLLEGYPDLQEVLDDTDLVPRGQNECPPLNILKDLFHDAVSKLGQRSFTCFVDALDECDEQQVVEMVHYFEDLAESCASKGVRLQICFSSRHYPYIRILHGIELTLEHQQGHIEDMDNYIQHNLRIRDTALVEELRPQMLEKASGVFLWVVLVVDILNKENRRGRLALRKRLADVPSGLSELFKDILRRDKDNMEDLLLCILWILCAKRPLRPEEYYHALWSGLIPKNLVDPEMPDVTVSDSVECVDSYVITSSKGLVEVTKSKSSTVQFIHESVRDFLIKDEGLRELWPDLGYDWESSAHDALKQSCSVYINHDLVRAHMDSLGPTSDSDGSAKTSKQFPFLEYASQHLLYHADAAAQTFPQGEFLSNITVRDWVKMYNLFEKFKIRKYSSTASLIYILADKGFSALIRKWLQSHPSIDIRGERYEYPLFAALANGHKEAVAALLNSTSSICEGVDTVEGFGSKTGFVGYKDRTPLTWAAQEGLAGIVRLLVRKDTDVYEVDREGYTSLMRASKAGHHAMAKLLVEKGVEIDAQDFLGNTALSFASRNGHLSTVKLLIENSAQIEPDLRGETPRLALIEASSHGHEAIVKFLLESGAESTACDYEGQTAISGASSRGQLAIVKLLIESGAQINPDAKGSNPEPALIKASMNGHVEVVRLLLERGANIETQAEDGRTPLIAASMAGHEKLARLLIEQRANVNAQDKDGKSPLHRIMEYHRYEGFRKLARVLIDKGADIHARDSEGSTPLHLAVISRLPLEFQLRVVKLLVEKGADIDDPNSKGNTPESLAKKRRLQRDHPLMLALKGL